MTGKPLLGLACVAALALSGCGNSAERDAVNLLRSIPAAIQQRNAPPPKITPAQIAQALQSTNKPVILIELEKRKGAQALMSEIERNGQHITFGTQARQVVVLNQGMITATRGLSGDLMSVDEDNLLALVRSRSSGTAAYDQRFLTPEDVTEVKRYVCTTRPGGGEGVSLGTVRGASSVITATCEGPDGSFSNTYAVADDGMIVAARQWVGAHLGFIITRVLQR